MPMNKAEAEARAIVSAWTLSSAYGYDALIAVITDAFQARDTQITELLTALERAERRHA
jgi:hypothetical protein